MHREQIGASGHLVSIGQGWSLWRTICVRGAGFPAAHALRLAAPAAAADVTALIAAQEAAAASRREALAACAEANQIGLPIVPARTLGRAIRQLRAGQVPEAFADPPGLSGIFAALGAAEAEVARLRDSANQSFSQAIVAGGEVLRGFARDQRFRSAVLWQNPAAIRGTFEALLRRPAGATDSKSREHERLVASYLQRYCLKNDTIGFFGPVGWARFSDAAEAIRLQPGPSLLCQRTVYFESWSMQLLAAELAQQRELRRLMVPRRMPTVRLEGARLYHSRGRWTDLPLEYARLLQACDGERTARAIAEAMVLQSSLTIGGEDEVYQLLEQLVEKRLITWTLELPTTDAHPERRLRSFVGFAPDSEARRQALQALDDLEAGRAAVAAAGDDATALQIALADLEVNFTRITGAAGVRRGGEAYAGRTLVFEDCQRDLALEFGAAFCARVAPPLRLLLDSARWYTYTIAERFKALCNRLFRALTEKTGADTVDFLVFWQEIEQHLTGSQYQPSALVAEVQQELQARWLALLDLGTDVRRVERGVADLAGKVKAAFSAPCPGWPGARYHSPDLLIAADGLDAIREGRYLTVLGELHTGDNTACNPVFVNQHPAPAELVAAVERDLPNPRILPVIPKERSTRADQISVARHDYDLEVGATRSARPRGQVLSIAALVVEEHDGQLRVRTHDGGHSFDVIALLEHNLKLESLAHFTLLPSAAHHPRVTIDGLVVARERWRIAPAELSFAQLPDAFDRFVGVQRWAATLGLPRFLFVKIPEEVKPCFLDLASPIYVEIFIKLVRRASVVSLSEMLPAPDETWLGDAEGNRYTCELRVVALDPEAWRPC